MIRVILFLVFVGLLALGTAWFADRPGDVSITWLGFKIETSVTVAVAAVIALVVASLMAWSLLRWAWQAPRRIRRAAREKRRARGYHALSRGLIAIGAGDVGTARKFAAEADRFAGDEPLALLLSAQTAQLAGDRDAAERAFRRMAGRADTKLIGLRGLYVEAQRHADPDAARGFAEAAALAAPGLPWAGQAALEFRCANGDWAGALAALESNMRGRVIDRPTYRRQRAVLLTAQAMALADTQPGEARLLAAEAAGLAPDLPPAAALAARLLVDNGDARKAGRLVEAAWRAAPHPDLADAYANLKTGDSARERLKRVQALTRQRAEHPEGAFAVARAALDAQEFATARAALEPLLAAPTRRVAMLMAELEEVGRGDEGRAREWMGRALRAKRDPAWTADGFVSAHWMPVSPVTGRLDAFQWKVPVQEIADTGPMIEAREPGAADTTDRAVPAITAEPPAASPPPPAPPEPEIAVAPVAVPAAAPLAPAPAADPAKASPPRRIDAVIPLVQAPDDPGPDSEPPSSADGDGRNPRSWFR